MPEDSPAILPKPPRQLRPGAAGGRRPGSGLGQRPPGAVLVRLWGVSKSAKIHKELRNHYMSGLAPLNWWFGLG